VWVFNKELKSVQRIAEKKGLRKEKEDLAEESAISLPEISEWLGAHKN